MTKIKCLRCGDTIKGDMKGTFIECKCKNIYIDETKHYCRVGFKEKDSYKIKNSLINKKKIRRVNKYEKERKYRNNIKTDKNKRG